MADFTPITTQAEFDAAIAERLSRQEKSIRAQFDGAMPQADVNKLRAGYDKRLADLNQQLQTVTGARDETNKQLTEALSKIKGYEADSVKTRIALEMGLPYGMAARLAGETEEDIRKDAESLRGLMKPSAAPLANPEPSNAKNTRDKFADWFNETMGIKP